ITLDNSNYPGDFQYMLGNQALVLQAGETRTHEDALPFQIAFDHGDGSEPARKLLTQGTYLVGVDASQQRIDLFDADSVESAGLKPAVAKPFADTPKEDSGAHVVRKPMDRQELIRKALKKEPEGKNVDRLLEQLKARQVAGP